MEPLSRLVHRLRSIFRRRTGRRSARALSTQLIDDRVQRPHEFEHLEPRLLLSISFSGFAFQVTDLGTLGGVSSVAEDINERGQVVGQAETSVAANFDAFIWEDGVITAVGGTGDSNIAEAISNNGEFGGFFEDTMAATKDGFRNDGAMNILIGTLGGTFSELHDINDAGQFVGLSENGSSNTSAFVSFDGTTLVELASQLGGTFSAAFGMNDFGHVVGDANDGMNDRAFLYIDNNSNQIVDAGEMIDLGTTGSGSFSGANAVNNRGQVVGSVEVSVFTHPFVWIDENLNGMSDTGEMVDLGTLGGDDGEAFDVNDFGQVVGTAQDSGAMDRAFIAQNGTMIDLNTLINPSSGFTLTDAHAINNKGQIVGQGTIGGQMHGFLLTPTPRYSAIDLGTLGGNNSSLNDINALGHAVGFAEDAMLDNRAVRFEDENLDGLVNAGEVVDIGTLGGVSAEATAINDSDEIVGGALDPGGNERPFLFIDANRNDVQDPGEMIDLGTFGGPTGIANDINERGQVVGVADDAMNPRPFLFTDFDQDGQAGPGEFMDLGTFGGPTGEAFGINNLGQVVGFADDAMSNSRAFLFEDFNGNHLVEASELVDLGTLGGATSVAHATNDNGQIVGQSLNGLGENRAFALADPGQMMVDLGTLGGMDSAAHDINNAGQIVGFAQDGSSNNRGFLWRDGVMFDLNDAVPTGTPTIVRAEGINDRGQIVAVADVGGGFERGFLLNPLPRYQVIDVGLATNALSTANAINKFSQIVGQADNGTSTDAYLFTDDNFNRVPDLDEVLDIPDTLPGAGSSEDVNDASVVIGTESVGDDPFLFQDLDANGAVDTGEQILLTGLQVNGAADARGINNPEEVVGQFTNAAMELHAYLWTDANFDRIADASEILDIGTLGGPISFANDVNDFGKVVGGADVSGSQRHAFVFLDDNSNRVVDGGELLDLGTLGGLTAEALGISNQFFVVGTSEDMAGDDAPFLFDDLNNDFLLDPGEMIDLGTFDPMSFSAAHGVNDDRQVVGESNGEAFTWINGNLVNLEDLLFVDSGFDLDVAKDINDQGQIVGTGFLNAITRGFLLQPAGLPPTAVADPTIDRLYLTNFIGSNTRAFMADTGSFEFTLDVANVGGVIDQFGVALGPDDNLYVSSETGDNVVRYDATAGDFIDVFVAAGDGGLDQPQGIEFGTDGNLYVADLTSSQVLRYDGVTGAFIDVFVPPLSGGMQNPFDLTFGPDNNLYVAEQTDVFRFDGNTGAFIDVFATGSGLSSPHGVIFGPDGNLYISDLNNSRVARFDATGAFIDNFATTNLLFPRGLEFGPNDDLFVVSSGDNRVVRFDGTDGSFITTFIMGENGPQHLTFAKFLDPVVAGATTSQFDIIYDDDVAIDVSSLDDMDITVFGPGFVTNATLVSVDIATDGTPRKATYQMDVHGGTLGVFSGGSYQVVQNIDEVFDVNGLAAPGVIIDEFFVDRASPIGVNAILNGSLLEIDGTPNDDAINLIGLAPGQIQVTAMAGVFDETFIGVTDVMLDSLFGSDTLTVDLGDAGVDVEINGGTSGASDTLIVLGTTGDDIVNAFGDTIEVGTSAVDVLGIEDLIIDVSQDGMDEVIVSHDFVGTTLSFQVTGGGAGMDSLVVEGGNEEDMAYVESTSVSIAERSEGSLEFSEAQFDGVGGVDGLDAPVSVAVSPDGDHVYVAGFLDDALTVFDRDPFSGSLSFIEVFQDDAAGMMIPGAKVTDGLAQPQFVTVSPDGQHVYVAAKGDNSVAVFNRDQISGQLTFIDLQRDGVGGVDGLAEAAGVAVSPDGQHVYVTGALDNSVAVFATGTLSFIEQQIDGVDGVDGLAGALLPIVSADGQHVYVVGEGDDAIAVFSRDPMGGGLTFVEFQQNGVGPVVGLNRPLGIALSQDGTQLFAAASDSDALTVFSRNVTTGALTFIQSIQDNLNGVDGLDGARSVAVGVDDREVFVTGEIDDSVAVFVRDPGTGLLQLVEVWRSMSGPAMGLDGARALATSPDGQSVYVTGEVDDAVAVFRRSDRLAVHYSAIDRLELITGADADEVVVQLGGLPTDVLIDGGSPTDSDVVILFDTSANENLTLMDNVVLDGTTNITLLGIELMKVDISEDGIDIVTVDQGFTGALNGFLVSGLAPDLTPLQTFMNPSPNADVFDETFIGVTVAALDANNVLVAAPGANGGAGEVHLFDANMGSFVRTFVHPDPGSHIGGFPLELGASVTALETDRILVGAEGSDTGAIDAGEVFLFDVNTGVLLQSFANPEPGMDDAFGISVAVVGTDKIVVGADLDDPGGIMDAGRAYLIDVNTGMLLKTFSNPSPQPFDQFGLSVAAVGTDKVIIGMPAGEVDKNQTATAPGEVHLFDINTGALLRTFANPNALVGDLFGTSVAAVGTDRVLIGAPGDKRGVTDDGSAFLFDVNTGDLLNRFSNPDPSISEVFGIAVASLGSDIIVIGAADDPDDFGGARGGGGPGGSVGMRNGAAYLFDVTTGRVIKSFQNPSEFRDDGFGFSLAAVGTDKVVVGAFGDSSAGPNTGAAFLFDVMPIADMGSDSITVNTSDEDQLAELDHRSMELDEQVAGGPAQLTFVEALIDGGTDSSANPINGLAMANSVVVSPDGRHVYASASLDDAVAVFARDAANGQLTFVEALFDGAIDSAGVTIDGIGDAAELAISPDGEHVYVASAGAENALAVFARDDTRGQLTFVEALFDGGTDAMGTTVDGLNGASSVTVSPDGENVYVASGGDNALAVFKRDDDSGKLAFVEALTDGGMDANSNLIDGLGGANAVTVGPDGDQVYVASSVDNALAVFQRNMFSFSDQLTFIEALFDGGMDAKTNTIDGLLGATFIIASPDEDQVYVAGFLDDALAVFDRDGMSGQLTFVEVLTDGGLDSAGNTVDGLDGIRSITFRPDTEHVFIASETENAVAVFERDENSGQLIFVERVLDGGMDGAGNTVDGIGGAGFVTISPDSRHVYAAGQTDNALAAFSTPASLFFIYAGIDTFNFNSGAGDDAVAVELGGLPNTVNIDAGLAPTSDDVLIEGTAFNDTVTLMGNTIFHGAVNLGLIGVEGIAIDGLRGDDTYVFDPGFPDVDILEAPMEGTDTLDFSSVTVDLTFNLASVTATDGVSTVSHADDNVENLVGGLANDLFVFADQAQLAGGTGMIDGGPGTDALDYTAYATSVTVDLVAGTATGTGGITAIENVLIEGVFDLVAPTAVAEIGSVKKPNAPKHQFRVTYDDNVRVDDTSFDNHDIRVTGPNGFDQLATFVSATGLAAVDIGNQIGAEVVAAYEISAPDTFFRFDDNGEYTAALEPGQILDINANVAVGTILDTFQVKVPPDATVPNAKLKAKDVLLPDGTEHNFIISYSDTVQIDQNTIDDDDIRVLGPNGFDQLAPLVDVQVLQNGRVAKATYRIDAPGGRFDLNDNGGYLVLGQTDEVFNSAGNPVLGIIVGVFFVRILPPPPPPPPPPSSLSFQSVPVVALEDADGTKATLRLWGNGTLKHIGDNDHVDLIVTGSDDQSNLDIDVNGGDGVFEVRNIIVEGSIRKITGEDVKLTGNLAITGSATQITLGDIDAQHVISVGAADDPNDTISFSFGRVTDLTMTTLTPIKSLTMIDWLDLDAIRDRVEAPSIAKLVATGDEGDGDFEADVFLDGSNDLSLTLGRADIAGTVRDALWHITGDAGVIKTGGAENWDFELNSGLRKFRGGRLIDTTFDVHGHINNIIVDQWQGGAIHSHTIDNLRVNDKTSPYGDGGFFADLYLAGDGEGETFRNIDVKGSVKNATWTIRGDGRKIAIRDEVDNLTLDVLSSVKAIKFGDTGTADVVVEGPVTSVTAYSWKHGSLEVDTLRRLAITGHNQMGIEGKIGIDVNVVNSAGSTMPIRSTRIAGDILGGAWRIQGNAGHIRANNVAAGWVANILGDLRGLTTRSDFNAQLAVMNANRINIGGNMTGATILTGADLSDDGFIGGVDKFGVGALNRFRVGGSVHASIIAVSIDPINGIFGDGDDRVVGGADSGIKSFFVGGSVDDDSFFAAGALPRLIRINGEVIVSDTGLPQLGLGFLSL